MDEQSLNRSELFAEWKRLEDLPLYAGDKIASYESAYHVWRTNRAQLIEANAVTTIAGRLYFHPERFEQVIVQLGMERTRERAEPSVGG